MWRSQDTFNKVVTLTLLLYVMTMYTLSWILNRPLNLENFWVLAGPVMTHGMHLLSNKIKDRGGSNGPATLSRPLAVDDSTAKRPAVVP